MGGIKLPKKSLQHLNVSAFFFGKIAKLLQNISGLYYFIFSSLSFFTDCLAFCD